MTNKKPGASADRIQGYNPLLVQSDAASQRALAGMYKEVVAHCGADSIDDLHVSDLFGVPHVGEVLMEAALMSQRAMAKSMGMEAEMIELTIDKEGTFKRCLTDPGVHFFWQHLRWLHSGRRIYDVSRELATALAHTRISAPGSAIAGGLPTAYIALPRDVFTLHKHALAAHTQTADGVYVTEMPLTGNDRVLMVLVVGSIDHVGSPIEAPSFQFSIPLRENEELESILDVDSEKFVHFLGPNAKNIPGILRLVCGLNLLLQGDARDELIKEVTARDPLPPALVKAAQLSGKKKGQELLKTHRDRIYYRLWRAGDGYKLKGTGEGGRTLDVRSLVRGHFRQQAHGPGRLSRKMIWIQPHWRGGDLPPSTATTVIKVK